MFNNITTTVNKKNQRTDWAINNEEPMKAQIYYTTVVITNTV